MVFPAHDLEGLVTTVRMGPRAIKDIDVSKHGVSSASVTNYQHRLVLQGFPAALGVWKHHRLVPQALGGDSVVPRWCRGYPTVSVMFHKLGRGWRYLQSCPLVPRSCESMLQTRFSY